ncbi:MULTISPECIES: response regulator transcription factor [Bacillaceae]|uniref:Two-component system response regulator n=1 Tax=Domibacillus aminovorans TaxID=29332 RepID=A0A177KQ87_9BACI|nr:MULTISPECIES: response regulator transcription factor [Bacillaceae]OAH54721.1 two-component system response regulator [Domibacillus aminovorans]
MPTILVAEDEPAISQVLKVYLVKAGFHVIQAYSGTEAIEKFHANSPSLVLLDVMMPGKDGWAVLKEIRAESACPVIMLTALNDVNYRLDGLDGGADDYIAKPFIADEMIARVRAVLRRSDDGKPAETAHTYGNLTIDFKAHRITLFDNEVAFTPRDLSLFLFLAAAPNRTFTREQLLDEVWGYDYDGSDRAVDLSVKRIRKVLAKWPSTEGEIKTLRGLGYQFVVEE